MRVGIASSSPLVGLWARIQDEGHEVRAWRGTAKEGFPKLLVSNRFTAKGIVPLCDSWYELLAWCKAEPSILLFDTSDIGVLADMARKQGVNIVGGGTFCDKLENKRNFGREIAEEAGIKSPDTASFSGVDDCIAYAKSGKLNRPVYWKTDVYLSGDATHKCDTPEDLIRYLTWIRKHNNPNITCILEDVIKGFALSTNRWWNGRVWVGPYMWTIEEKPFMPGGIGPSTGCSLNAVGFYEDDAPLISEALNWENLAGVFRKHDAPPCLYDINAVLKDGEAYFLEWTPRLGYDSETTSQMLYPDLSAWLAFIATGSAYAPEPDREQFAASVRVTVTPAPWEHGERDEKGSCVGMYVTGPTGNLWGEGFVGYDLMKGEDGLEVSAAQGIVGLAAAVGDTLSEMETKVMAVADEIRCASRPAYRNDLFDAVSADYKKCVEAGFDDLPLGLGE